jgi:hypothetical protein
LLTQNGENQPPEFAMPNSYSADRFVFIALVVAALISNLPW